jgi:hypothetical protein
MLRKSRQGGSCELNLQMGRGARLVAIAKSCRRLPCPWLHLHLQVGCFGRPIGPKQKIGPTGGFVSYTPIQIFFLYLPARPDFLFRLEKA